MSPRYKPTEKQLAAAHGIVHRKLNWIPAYSSQDEVISALRHLANRLQAEVTFLRKKVR